MSAPAGSPPSGEGEGAAGGEPPKLTVFYDGGCPLCRREVRFYGERPGGEAIEWVDASALKGDTVAPGLTREEALARFHVRLSDGRLESGPRAFAALWNEMPGLRWLAAVARRPAAQPFLEAAYRAFLKVRPAAQRLAWRLEARARPRYPRWLERDLRSNHAGESGAVAIYRGILAVSRTPELRAFARRHLLTERRHLALMRELLPPRRRSLLDPAWFAAGFVTGAIPALAGSGSVYATIEAVETFVDRHYREQIARLDATGGHAQVRAVLEACRQDEVAHRDEARARAPDRPGWMLRLWLGAVALGSVAGVAVARRL